MGVLHNPRHELFAQARAQGHTVAESYRIAGGKSPRPKRQGDQMAKHHEIKKRILEILDQQATLQIERVALGKDEILRELVKNSGLARELGNINASNKALELYGMEQGMFVRRSERKSGALDPIDGADEEDLLELIARGVEELAGPDVHVDRDLLRKAVKMGALDADPESGAARSPATDGSQDREAAPAEARALPPVSEAG